MALVAAFGTLLAGTARADLFGRPVNYPVDGAPIGVRSGEINGMGGVDLVAGNATGLTGPSMSRLFNAGGAQSFVTSSVPIDPGTRIVNALGGADFNGDGVSDTVVAVDDAGWVPPRLQILVFDGSSSAEYEVEGVLAQCLETADLTGDGILDLILCHSAADSGRGMISVLPGEADVGGAATGRFLPAVQTPVGAQPKHLAAGDVDIDGRADLIVADVHNGRIFVLYGNGTPALFDAAVRLGEVVQPSSLSLARIDADAHMDVLVTDAEGDAASLWRQIAPRFFVGAESIPTGGAVAAGAVADFDGDGNVDFAVGREEPAELIVSFGDGRGGFSGAEDVPLSRPPSTLLADDLDADGRTDLVAASLAGNQVMVFLNGKARSFASDCGTEPRTGCLAADASRLIIKIGRRPEQNRLKWKWKLTEQPPVAGFGDPVGDAIGYTFCLYDEVDGVSEPVMSGETRVDDCAGSPCWLPRGTNGYRYTDDGLYPDGLYQLAVSAGTSGKSSIALMGRGATLSLPTLPLSSSPRVVAQIVRNDGSCWESVYDAKPQKNMGFSFKAKSRVAR